MLLLIFIHRIIQIKHGGADGIEREAYRKKLRSFRNKTELVKILVGVWRSGNNSHARAHQAGPAKLRNPVREKDFHQF